MRIEAQTEIDAPVDEVWQIASDVGGFERIIDAVEKIEILEQPDGTGMLGLRWRETRTMFGKTATEEMTVVEADEADHFTTRAESHGSVYTMTYLVGESGSGSVLSVAFDADATSLASKVMALTVGQLFKGATRKAFEADLADIRRACSTGGAE